MGGVSDRRNYTGRVGGENRSKYLARNKEYIKNKIKEMVKDTKIKDILDKKDVSIPPNPMDEPSYAYDTESGKKTRAVSGNKGFVVKDRIPVDKNGAAKGVGGTKGDEGEDDFIFTLTKEEMYSYLFDDMELPNFVKQGLTKVNSLKLVRRGYAKEGIPSRINIKKTMEFSLARRIAARKAIERNIEAATEPKEKERLKNKKIPFIDDVDLRYDRTQLEKKNIKHAVIVLLMDVSGSMGEYEKDIAKRFMLLVCVFLERFYTSVDLRFVIYHSEATEVTEEDFFYKRNNGATFVTKGLAVCKRIMDEYDPNHTNIYVVHAGDGDYDFDEMEHVVEDLRAILDKVQYYAYVEIINPSYMEAIRLYDIPKLSYLFLELSKSVRHLGAASVAYPSDVYPAIRKLFKKG